MWGYDQVINQHLRGINGMIGGIFRFVWMIVGTFW